MALNSWMDFALGIPSMATFRLEKIMFRFVFLMLCILESGISLADPIKIVAFGGSNTFGKNISRAEAYPAQLEQILKADGFDVVVVNEGTNGQTTSDELGKVHSSIPIGTRIVIFQPGGNDNKGRRLSAMGNDTQGNIEAIVRSLLDRKILVLFSGGPNKRTYVEKFGIPTIDEINQLAPADLQGDGQHLTPKGYRIVAEKMAPQVKELLGKLNSN